MQDVGRRERLSILYTVGHRRLIRVGEGRTWGLLGTIKNRQQVRIATQRRSIVRDDIEPRCHGGSR